MRLLTQVPAIVFLAVFAVQVHASECLVAPSNIETQEPSIGVLDVIFEEVRHSFQIGREEEARANSQTLLDSIKASSRVARGILYDPSLAKVLGSLPELQTALTKNPKLLDPLRKKSAVTELYAMNAGGDSPQSVEQRTLSALDLLADQMRFQDLDVLKTTSTPELARLLRYTVAVRDLGRGIAVRAGNPDLASALNPVIARRVLEHLGFKKREIQLAETLLENTDLRAALDGTLPATEAAKKIGALARKTREDPRTLFKLQALLFSSRAATDPALRDKYLKQESIGRWAPKSPRFTELEKLIAAEQAKIQARTNGADYHPFVSAEAKQLFLSSYDRRAAAWPIPSEEVYVDTAYGKTFVRVSGPVDGPPMILLPGANTSSLMWIPNIEELAKARRVYAIDSVATYGRSVTERAPKDAKEHVAWLNETLTQLGIEKEADVVGVSYGGWVASEFALAHPERLNSLALLAPAATVQPVKSEFLFRILLSKIPNLALSRGIYDWLAADSLRNGDKTRATLKDLIVERELGESTFKSIIPARPLNLTDAQLRDFKMPVLFVVGENDKIFSPKKAIKRLNRVAPGIQTHLIPRAGHDLTIAQPELVNDALLQFLDQKREP